MSKVVQLDKLLLSEDVNHCKQRAFLWLQIQTQYQTRCFQRQQRQSPPMPQVNALVPLEMYQ